MSAVFQDDIAAILPALRQIYSQYNQLLPYPGAREAVPIESHYVNLALLTGKEQDEKERSEKGEKKQNQEELKYQYLDFFNI